MKASLIFSSTSHSINVQKVRIRLHPEPPIAHVVIDFQDCSVQSLRPQVHYPRDRKHWRATSPLPGRLVAGPQSQTQDRTDADESIRIRDCTHWTRLLSERYHERMNFMIYLRGIAWLGDWSTVLYTWAATRSAFFFFVFVEGSVRLGAWRARSGRPTSGLVALETRLCSNR
jgi:hypothetical protein